MVEDYSDGQIRSELIAFFGWRTDDVYKLSAGELSAWKRHAVRLREAGFWWGV